MTLLLFCLRTEEGRESRYWEEFLVLVLWRRKSNTRSILVYPVVLPRVSFCENFNRHPAPKSKPAELEPLNCYKTITYDLIFL